MQFRPFIVFMNSVRCSITHPTRRSSHHPNPFIPPKCYIRLRQSPPSVVDHYDQGLSHADLIMGRGRPVKTLSTGCHTSLIILVTVFLIQHNNLIIHHIFDQSYCHLIILTIPIKLSNETIRFSLAAFTRTNSSSGYDNSKGKTLLFFGTVFFREHVESF